MACLPDTNPNFEGGLRNEIEIDFGSGCDGSRCFECACVVGRGKSGEIDEVRTWSRTLAFEEIQATMNITLNGNEPGLVGYWNFDDGTANDSYTYPHCQDKFRSPLMPKWYYLRRSAILIEPTFSTLSSSVGVICHPAGVHKICKGGFLL